jgi:hypothetical protein
MDSREFCIFKEERKLLTEQEGASEGNSSNRQPYIPAKINDPIVQARRFKIEKKRCAHKSDRGDTGEKYQSKIHPFAHEQQHLGRAEQTATRVYHAAQCNEANIRSHAGPSRQAGAAPSIDPELLKNQNAQQVVLLHNHTTTLHATHPQHDQPAASLAAANRRRPNI